MPIQQKLTPPKLLFLPTGLRNYFREKYLWVAIYASFLDLAQKKEKVKPKLEKSSKRMNSLLTRDESLVLICKK